MLIFGKACEYDDDVVATATAAVSAVELAAPGNGVRMRGQRRNAVSAPCSLKEEEEKRVSKSKGQDEGPAPSLMSAASRKMAVCSSHSRAQGRTQTVFVGTGGLDWQDNQKDDSQAQEDSWVFQPGADGGCGTLEHTPLIQAAMAGIVSDVRKLLSADCQPDVQDEMGMTALMWTACSLYYPASWKQDHAGVASLLLESKASVDLEDNNGVTALMHALAPATSSTGFGAFSGFGHSLAMASHRHGRSSLYWERACLADGIGDMIRLLIGAGADIDHRNKDRMTPLMLAAAIGSVGSLNILLEAKASVDLQDTSGQTALEWARQRSDADKAEMMEAIETASA